MKRILGWLVILVFVVFGGSFGLSINGGLMSMSLVIKILAFLGAGSLYLALLSGPIEELNWLKKDLLMGWRNFWGAMAIVFAAGHGSLAFFGQLGGLEGWSFLPDSYIKPIVLGASTFVLLIVGGVFIWFLNASWRTWRYLGYIASIFMVWHVLLIGTHFVSTSSWPSRVGFGLLAVLLLLQTIAIDDHLLKSKNWRGVGWVTTVALVILVGVGVWMNMPLSTSSGISIHSQHLSPVSSGSNLGRRLSVSMNTPENIAANKDVELNWKVYDANNGTQITQFVTVYEKLVHLIVVNSDLNYFEHLHPEYDPVKGFSIKTKFLGDGQYRLYVDFTPLGETFEQQFGFVLPVGKDNSASKPSSNIDSANKRYGDYEIGWRTEGNLNANKLSSGQQQITFSFKKNGQDFKTLQPYLGAFGHLVMINTQTYQYVHIHPIQSVRLTESDRGGPEIVFMPMGLNGPIASGVYKMFGQFKPDGNLIVTDFTVKIE